MRRLFAAFMLAALGACGGSSDATTNPNSDDITGAYTIKTVNGNPLPFTIQGSTTTLVLVSDAITVASNGTWSETYTTKQTAGGQTTNGTGADNGTWTRVGSAVNFFSTTSAATAYTGSYASGSLTLSSGGFIEVFSR